MKKIFTTLFATAAVFCASATTPTFTVKPVDGTVLDNKVQEVTFTFSESVTVTKIGFASGPLNQRQFSVDDKAQTGKTIKAQILESYWGKAQDGEISMQVLCMDVLDAKGDTIKNAEGYPEQFIVNYSYKDDSAAKFLYVYPAANEVTVAEMYGTGVDVYFSGEVSFDETSPFAPVEINYSYKNGKSEMVEVSADDIWGSWNWRDNTYFLSIPLPEVSGISASEIATIEVNLYDVCSNGEPMELDIPIVTYSLQTLPQSAPNAKKTPKSKMSLGVSSENYDIYTIQGVRLSNTDINSLKNGIYIINGKKVVVK